ncbi:hypothetical protein [Streptomyces cinereospinus]|uniref:Uncharacterized protein n=1 Tax=Streptomyces cinereospinus TaxID=285561 RepID=A0ABV5N2G6_9ACTN
MTHIADDSPTTPDRAAKARLAWELYHGAHGGEISDLITDLMHLADVDDHQGGGARAARHAVADFLDEQPIWEPTPVYLGQYQPAGQDWITVAQGDESTEPEDVAGCLWTLMQKADFRTAEIPEHVKDLARGEVLVADNGTAFRVIKNPALTV